MSDKEVEQMDKKGSIVCIGGGMTIGAHLTPRNRSYIEQADVVFVAGHHALELWLAEMNDDVRSLQYLYGELKERKITYREMVTVMMEEVRAGKQVVAAFYGHPGVFAWSTHRVIKVARKEGYHAHMEPGISAEDCLFADLGIDPGTYGCQNFEASQMMFFERRIDPSAYLILWQASIAGSLVQDCVGTGHEHRRLLVELLSEHYPLDHKVALYECPTLPINQPRIEWITLEEFISADVSQITTLVLPPAKKMSRNHAMLEKLKQLETKLNAQPQPA